MSKADKIFKELGYKRIFESDSQIVYENLGRTPKRIDIRVDEKDIYINFQELFENIYDNCISFKVLQAINEKVKELRMGLEKAKLKGVE